MPEEISPTSMVDGAIKLNKVDRRKIETPEETKRLQQEAERVRDEYKRIDRDYNNARSLLNIVQQIKAGDRSREGTKLYIKVQRRLQQKFPGGIDGMIMQYANATQEQFARLEKKEMELLFAELRASGVGPLETSTYQDTIKEVDARKSGSEHSLNSSVATEIQMRLQNGEKLEDIRGEAQAGLEKRNVTARILEGAQKMKAQRGKEVPPDIREAILIKLGQGQSLDTIIERTQANMKAYADLDKKKQRLAELREKYKQE